MKKLNLSSRVIMFSICTSIEYDLKCYLNLNSEIDFTSEMIEKAKFRNAKINIKCNEEVLNQLDLFDFISLILSNPYAYKINNCKAQKMKEYFEKIIPIRNRVMHTKPLELGDRAILQEALEEIDKEIVWIEWNEIKKTRDILFTDPSQLILREFKKVAEYNPGVYHNLPDPEFDDTGYIGRRNDIKQIKQLIYNHKNQIITIVGNGGMGKTALAVKILYEMTEDPENPFEAILWISLKTKTMARGEFIKIQSAIEKVSEIYYFGEKIIIAEDGLSPEDNLINFMDRFKVLLVLDNLETINSEDINSFIKRIPDNSKLLITSRHGIGELEYRYKLEGMILQDAISYFRELSKFYGLPMYRKSDLEIKELVIGKLYSNPLSIKWFINGIFNGLSEEQIISARANLVEFCMSNVYDKLSDASRQVLQLFLIENMQLTLGEIDYFLDIDDVSLRSTINELFSTNMITLNNGNYMLIDMARDYLSIYHAPNNEFVINTLKKRKSLNIILQNVKVKKENDPFNLNCTPIVRQYDILKNNWGDFLCQREYRTKDIRQSLRSL